MNTTALELHDLTVSYDRRPALWGIDLHLPLGCMAGVMGPNGSGKTTLLKAVMGLLPLSSGYVKIFGDDLAQVRSRISYVPQRASVDWDFPASVLDVVLMGRYGQLGLLRRPSRADKELALRCLEQVGMADLRHRQIAQLSGGQQQRTFLARALAQEAEMYFLDEPFAGVDMATETAIITVLRGLQQRGCTVVVVHHDLRTAPEYFDWLVLLNQRLVATGPMHSAYTEVHLQEAYGGRLTMLQQIADQLQARDFPQREKK